MNQDAVQVVVVVTLQSVILPPFAVKRRSGRVKNGEKRFTSFSSSLGDATGARD